MCNLNVARKKRKRGRKESFPQGKYSDFDLPRFFFKNCDFDLLKIIVTTLWEL